MCVSDPTFPTEPMSKFDQLAAKLASQGASNPKGLAAYIGNKKYGSKVMHKAAATHMPAAKVAHQVGMFLGKAGVKPGSKKDRAMEKKMGMKPGSKMDRRMEMGG